MASAAHITSPDGSLRAIPPALAAEVTPSSLSSESGGLVSVEAHPHVSGPNQASLLAGVEDVDPVPAIFLPLPVGVSVAIPVRNFRVRNLLAMCAGAVLETQWAHGEDMPLASGNVQLAWTEFEVIDTQLAVRVTRLA